MSVLHTAVLCIVAELLVHAVLPSSSPSSHVAALLEHRLSPCIVPALINVCAVCNAKRRPAMAIAGLFGGAIFSTLLGGAVQSVLGATAASSSDNNAYILELLYVVAAIWILPVAVLLGAALRSSSVSSCWQRFTAAAKGNDDDDDDDVMMTMLDVSMDEHNASGAVAITSSLGVPPALVLVAYYCHALVLLLLFPA
jgi:hypothetical protein